MAVEIATAYVSLVPSMAGASAALSRELGGPAETAGADAGRRGGSAFTGALGGVLAGAGLVAAFAIVGDAFNQAITQADMPGALRSQFALSEADAAKASRVAGEVYAKGFGESLSTVGETAAGVTRELQLLGETGDLTELTTQAQVLADKFGEDVNPLITAAGQLVKTGMAPDFASAMDIITVGLSSGTNAGNDFLDTITEYSVQFEKFGLDADVSLGLMNQGLQAGARNSDLVADAIKEFSIRAIDGSALTAQGFQAVGLDAQDMAAKIAAGGPEATAALDEVLDSLRAIEDPVARDAAAVALFGTQAEDLGAALYALDPSTATEGLGEVAGAAENLADAAGEGTQAKINELTRSFNDGLSDALVQILPALTALIDAIVPLLPVLTPIAIGIAALAVAQWAWNAALLANPIVLIIALIIAAIVLLVVYWDEVVAALAVAWQWVSDLAVTVWTAIADFFVMVWEWIVNAVDTGVQGVLDFFAYLGSLPGMAWEWFLGVLDAAVGAGLELLAWASGLPGEVLDALGNVASYLWDAGVDLLDGLWRGMKSMAGSILDWIWGLLSDMGDAVLDFFGIASPSRLMRSYGQFIGEGLALGIKDSVADVAASTDLMVHAADLETPATRGLLAEMDRMDAAANSPVQIEGDLVIQAADNRYDPYEIQKQVAMRTL